MRKTNLVIGARVSVAQLRELGGLEGLMRETKRSAHKNRLICVDGRPSEESEQRDLTLYLDGLQVYWGTVLDKRLVWTGTANGGKRHRGAAGALKAQGVKPGVSDVLIFNSPPAQPRAKGLAIEMKREFAGTLSDDQVQWSADLASQGWAVECCHGFEAAKALIIRLGYDPRGGGRDKI